MYNKKYLKKCMAVILSASMVMPTSIASMASEPATEVTTEAAAEETEIAQTEAATEEDAGAAVETEAVEAETEQTENVTEAVSETVTESAAVQESATEEAAVLSDDWDDEYSVDFKMLYFDSDGSDLWFEEHIVYDSSSWTFDPYVPVKEGYTFKGWATKEGSSTVVYKAGDKITVTEAYEYEKKVYLYAVWEKQGTTYKVTYYNEDGSQELKTDSKVSTAESCSFNAYAGAPKKDGYEFIGWSTKPNATAIDYNTTKGPSLKSTSPELKLYAVYVKTVQNEDVKVNVYVEYLDESLEKGYEVDESSKKEVTVTCKTAGAHKEAGYTHQLKYKDIADAANPGSIKVKDGYEIVGMTKNAGTNQGYYGLDNTAMIGGMMQNGSFYLVAKKKQGTTYKVTYYNEDGSQELKTDSKVSTADSCSFSAYSGAAKKEGYEFIGWSKTPNATAIDYNTTKGPVLKSTSPELKVYAVYVKTVQNEDVKLNVYVEYLDERLEKGYEVDETSKKEVTVTCETTYAHKESGSVHQLKYKTIADAADVSSFKVRDGYEIVGMTKNAGANEVYFALDNTFMTSGMMQDGSFYLVAKKAKQPETEPGTEESESEKQTESESEKQTESESEKQTESESEKQTESESEKQPESETEKKQPESETEKKQETEKQPESETEKKQETEKQPETEAPSKQTSTTVMRLRGNASSTRVRLAWTGIKGADGYEIYGANCKVSTKAPLVKTVKNGSTYVTAISGLKKASSYRYYVRAYKMINGKKTYLNQSNVIYIATACGTRTNAKAVTVASTSITLKKGKTKNLSATVTSVNSKKKLFYRTAKLTYTTTDKKIATVTSRGTVTAKAKGTCYIYVSAANGVYTKVKVTVN